MLSTTNPSFQSLYGIAAYLSEVDVFESNLLSRGVSHVDMLFASCGYVLLINDNCAIWHEDRDQGMEFHDLPANHQHIPPALGKGDIFLGDEFQRLAMSELRWNISP